MSDAQLLNCYHGIQDRIKDIDSRIDRESPLDHAGNRDTFFQQTYFVGGETHGLMQKEKVVLKEMKKRKMKP